MIYNAKYYLSVKNKNRISTKETHPAINGNFSFQPDIQKTLTVKSHI